MSLRIAHLSIARGFPGLVRQLEYEYWSARQIADIEWKTLAYTYDDDERPFVKRLPRVFQGIFRRKLFGWIWLLRHAKEYDFVMMRHMTFDPFALILAYFVKNRVVIFHSKTDRELPLIRPGMRGRAAGLLEKISRDVVVRMAAGVLGVTEEIRDYHVNGRKIEKPPPSTIYPNGILVEKVTAVDDRRSDGVLEIGFMCGAFAQWHGLDLIMNALDQKANREEMTWKVVLHLIGTVNETQRRAIDRFNEVSRADRIVWHGCMNERGYRTVFARCHVGLGALAVERQNLNECATLKVREMLAMGVPVYSGHRDAAIPDDFSYYRVRKGDLLGELIDFALENRATDRQTVRELASPYIDKVARMRAVADFLAGIKAG